MRIGIDVGGTNTDAVLMDGLNIVTSSKTPTTADVTGGILSAVRQVQAQSGVQPDEIDAIMLGTTHFTNAIVEGKRLTPTAVIRLGAPATVALPPLVDWPQRLRDTLGKHTFIARGGYEFDGRQIAALDEKEIRDCARQIADSGVTAVAISCVFSPVNVEMEETAAAIVREEIPAARVTASHNIGRLGLLPRENAAVLNACVSELAQQTIESFIKALGEFQLKAPLFLTQNDGTLMNAEFAVAYPVLTLSSGPTNSMRGAAFLSGTKDAVVADIGGTTTDVGVLVNGFPREASDTVRVGDVRTNFRMPDTYSFGLGGGSLVQSDPVMVGPKSVGYELTKQGLVFGGDRLTATDIAVAAGLADIGDRKHVAALDGQLVTNVTVHMETMVADAIDRMKTNPDPVPVIMVGGGSVLVGDELEGTSEVVRPDHFSVANAIGAAIAKVGGEVDVTFKIDEVPRDEALEQAKTEAIAKTIKAGASEDTVEIVDVDEIPLTYLPGNALRVRVKAVGDLQSTA